MNKINPREDKKAVAEIVCDILDKYPIGKEFSGWELADEVSRRTGKREFPDTALRIMRDYRKDSKSRNVVNTNRMESLYKIVGKKLPEQMELFDDA